MKNMMTFSFLVAALISSSTAAADGTDFAIAVPLVAFNSESIAGAEMNLGMEAGVAIEASYIHEHDRVDEEITDETGEAMTVNHGRSFSVHVARYSDAKNLGGFYWSLGVGYQTMDLNWTVPADESDPDIDYALVNDAGTLAHHAVLSGYTGQGRLGYRYVAADFPFMAGIYLGIRHFQAGVEDYDEDLENNEDEPGSIATLTDSEKSRLQRKFATSFTPSLAIGFAF